MRKKNGYEKNKKPKKKKKGKKGKKWKRKQRKKKRGLCKKHKKKLNRNMRMTIAL